MSNLGSENYFEPLCKWRRNEEQDVVEVHLPGFKHEQLKATINEDGVLKITGDRWYEESSSFRKEIVVSKDCKRDEIVAKFSAGVIYITMPKKTPNSCLLLNSNGRVTALKLEALVAGVAV